MPAVSKLTIISPSATYTHHITDTPIRIGRSNKCEFVIAKEDLSREHCLFEIDGDDMYITDLSSKNGTSVDRVRIPANSRVKITQQSVVTLANIYNLKIDELQVQTKIDIVLRKAIAEEELPTTTFRLDLDTVPLQKKTSSQAKKRKTPEGHERKPQKKQIPENLKMIFAFAAILAFVIYQALGR